VSVGVLRAPPCGLRGSFATYRAASGPRIQQPDEPAEGEETGEEESESGAATPDPPRTQSARRRRARSLSGTAGL
jgi:hypothetical protein